MVIEYVLIDNFVIDFFILFLTSKLLTLNYKVLRLVFAALFGAALALVFPVLNLHIALQILLKILVAITMLLIAFKSSSFKNFALIFLVFISITCLFGGIFVLISLFEYGSLDAMTITLYNKDIPMGLITIMIAFYVFLFNGVINYIKNKIKLTKFIFPLTIKTKFKCVKINAYLDSAHNLIDPETQLPVVIINFSTLNKLYKIPIEKIITKQLPKDIPNARYINYETIESKNNKMLVFLVEELKISSANKKILKNQIVGLSLVDFKKNFNCDALISPQMF